MVYIVSSNINSDNINMAIIQIKRAYDPASATDGYRVYIDSLWPRGLSHDFIMIFGTRTLHHPHHCVNGFMPTVIADGTSSSGAILKSFRKIRPSIIWSQ